MINLINRALSEGVLTGIAEIVSTFQARKAVSMEVNKHQLLIEHLPAGFAYLEIVTNINGEPVDSIFRMINRSFEQLTGLPGTEILNKKITDLSTRYDTSGIEWINARQCLDLEGKPQNFEYHVASTDRWFEGSLYSYEPGFFAALFWEITRQKKDELDHIYRNKSLKTLFDNSMDAVVSIDADDHIVDINNNFTEMFGYTLKEVAGRHIDDVMEQGKEGSTNKESTASVLAGNKVHEEGTRYTRQGTPLEVLIRAIPILIDGKRAGAYAFYSNITERKKAERELRERESKYNAVFEGSHDAVTIVSEEGLFIDCNKRTLTLFGLTNKEEFCMSRPADRSPLLQPDGRTSLEISNKMISEALRTKKHVHFEWVHRRKNGETFPAEVILKAFTLDGKTVLQGSVRDITERKQSEEKLRYISFHDNLTGTYNRSYLDEEIKRLDTDRQLPISIIMADLNGLKLINDTYGHTKGDEMLVKAAEIIQKACRQDDIIARWGGDEFVVFLPKTTKEEALMIGSRITNHCRYTRIKELPISMALGIASKTSRSTALDKVLKDAEDNMYKQKLTESRSTKNIVLKTLLKTLAEKSFETERHARRMQEIARQIGEKLKLPDAELKRLELLITLHDIGKINISEEILTKKEALTEVEWEIIKKHPEIGYRIARATEEFAHVAQDILAHHERWDGSGYPQGLHGKNIPLLARITAIADAYEVMTNGRPYKKALSFEEVIDEFKKCAGTQFDPDLTEIFLSCFTV